LERHLEKKSNADLNPENLIIGWQIFEKIVKEMDSANL